MTDWLVSLLVEEFPECPLPICKDVWAKRDATSLVMSRGQKIQKGLMEILHKFKDSGKGNVCKWCVP